MRNRFKTTFMADSDEAILSKAPVIVAVFLVYLCAMFFQDRNKLSSHEIAGTTIVMLLQLFVYLFSDRFFRHKYWIYFVIQGVITFDYAVIVPKGYVTILLGLIPVLIIQSMSVYSEGIKVVITSVFFYGIFCGTIVTINGVKELIHTIPILIIITIGMRAYSIILLQQVKLRIKTQKLLQELELAYEKVEELTLVDERQRVARDLHDTLSQGLAGIIMQLEAVNANLNNNNTKRAHEIVQKSMEHARKTLSDARLVIDDLRHQSNNEFNFDKALEAEITTFRTLANITIKSNIRIVSKIPLKISKHILYIVREGLNNVIKHSKSENAAVEVIENNGQLDIIIKDDGIGFDIKLLDHLFGHYGILGMGERVKAINGKMKIKSKRKEGTYINIIIPIEKGNL